MGNEKVMKNSKDIAQINTETDNLRNSFIKNNERNNDIAIKVAQLSLSSSNTQTEIEKFLETTTEFNQIRTEIATIRDEISNIKCINRNKFEETYNSIKGIEHDISVCTNNLSEYKTVMENHCMQIKEISVRKEVEKQEGVKQKSTIMNTKKDGILISEKAFRTFVNQSIDNSINKSREEIFAVIESKDLALKKEIEEQGDIVEEQIKKSQKHR